MRPRLGSCGAVPQNLDKSLNACIVVRVKSVPSLTLPSRVYDEMLSMSDRRLVCLLRAEVLSPERSGRFSPRPPAEHDAYRVCHLPDRISIYLCTGGVAVFRCDFVPPVEY